MTAFYQPRCTLAILNNNSELPVDLGDHPGYCLAAEGTCADIQMSVIVTVDRLVLSVFRNVLQTSKKNIFIQSVRIIF